MHISDGILDARWCAAGYAAAVPLVAWSLRTLDRDAIPRVSVMGAAFFVASLVHFPVGATSVHVTLIGLTGLLLGGQATLAILTGLFFQAVMFQHGGLTTLGLNVFTMGVAALLCHRLFLLARRLVGDKRACLSVAGGMVSGTGVLVAAVTVSVVLWVSSPEYAGIAAAFSVANAVVALVEGVATAFIVDQVLRVKPELLISHGH